MPLDVKSITKAALGVLFNLGGDLVKDATYYRPPFYNPATGTVVTAEVAAACKILVGSISRREFAGFVINVTQERVLIRASELVAISVPAEGDYIVQADGTRRNIVDAPRLDPTGELWTFQTERSLGEDWGDLAAFTASEDWSDLTAATVFEDRGALF